MIELEVFQGCCTIQLYRKVSGCNYNPHTIVWEICGNTLIDECDFQGLNQHRWLMAWNSHTKSYYVQRWKKFPNGNRVNVLMAREILGLLPGVGNSGDQADHKNHDTQNHRRYNLRIVTPSQNNVNTRKKGSQSRFRGVVPHRYGFWSHISYHGYHIYFPLVKFEAEAGLMYNYAANLLFGEFANLNVIPEDEMPSEERQCELWDMVVAKLTKIGILKASV